MTDYGEMAGDVVLKFIEAVRDEDAAAFWELLDMQGKGYFLGLWSYVLPDVSLNAIMSLAGDPGFIGNTMGSIIMNLKNSISDFINPPLVGDILFDDDLHARVSVGNTTSEGEEVNNFEYIPLVMELVSVSKAGQGEMAGKAGSNLTCWKIDTLKCLKFHSGMQQA